MSQAITAPRTATVPTHHAGTLPIRLLAAGVMVLLALVVPRHRDRGGEPPWS